MCSAYKLYLTWINEPKKWTISREMYTNRRENYQFKEILFEFQKFGRLEKRLVYNLLFTWRIWNVLRCTFLKSWKILCPYTYIYLFEWLNSKSVHTGLMLFSQCLPLSPVSATGSPRKHETTQILYFIYASISVKDSIKFNNNWTNFSHICFPLRNFHSFKNLCLTPQCRLPSFFGTLCTYYARINPISISTYKMKRFKLKMKSCATCFSH